MRLDLKETAALNDEEAQALRRLHEAVYPPRPRPAPEGPRITWARLDWKILLWNEANQLVANAGAITRPCLCDGRETLIGGIGDVKTHPQQRGKGHAGAVIGRATDFLRGARRVDFLLLFCRAELTPFYERLGFSVYAGDTLVMQDDVTTAVAWNKVMVMPGLKEAPKCKVIDLCGLPW